MWFILTRVICIFVTHVPVYIWPRWRNKIYLLILFILYRIDMPHRLFSTAMPNKPRYTMQAMLHELYHTGYTPQAIPLRLWPTAYTVKDMAHRLYHTVYTIAATPCRLYPPGYTINIIHARCTILVILHRLYHADFTMQTIPCRLYPTGCTI